MNLFKNDAPVSIEFYTLNIPGGSAMNYTGKKLHYLEEREHLT